MPQAGVVVADGVIELDTLLGGWERVTAGYLIEGDAPVLVETGSQSSVPVLLAQLDDLGVGPRTWPAWWSPTSTSTTPEGSGDVARRLPEATVYVHPKGARHLADPTRLVDSAARVYGAAARLALRSPRPDSRRADPRTGGRRGDPGRAPTAR